MQNKTEFRFADGCHLSPAPLPFSILFKTMFHFFMMMITKKEKAKEPPGTRQAGKGFEKMKIQPIVCRGAEAKPADR
ncbi:hypothetical protein LNQ03_23055 [Klebsiella pneumoniae subsp. pneumoniae]|nr:hypothetical protein [Klebsiella pneumoniae subsp. pneumoniae]